MFRSLKLRDTQERAVRNAHIKCVNTCDFLHSDDSDKARECADACNEQNKDLYRMANASSVAALFAIGLFVGALLFAYKTREQ